MYLRKSWMYHDLCYSAILLKYCRLPCGAALFNTKKKTIFCLFDVNKYEVSSLFDKLIQPDLSKDNETEYRAVMYHH